MADTAGGQWVTLAQATVFLGVSDRTLRRQIAAGQYRTQRNGGRRLVCVPVIEPGRAVVGEGEALAVTAARADGHETAKAATNGGVTVKAASEEIVAATLKEWRSLLEQERQRAGAAEQAAAMWQERARNLETQVEQLLALPAHEEEPELRPPWWAFWRRR
mgnify:CR=1 FL=1